MKVLLIDTDNLQPRVIETTGGIREWYRLIKCDMIDITSLSIGGRYYDVIVDDEGLLKDGIKKIIVGDVGTYLKNSEGWDLEITDKSLPEIEDAIEDTKIRAEKDYRFWNFLLSYFPKMYKQYDDLIKAFFLAYDREIGKTAGERWVRELDNFADTMKGVLMRTFEGEAGEWEDRQEM